MHSTLNNRRPIFSRGRIGLALAAVVVLGLAVYGQIIGHGFVVFDDGAYVYENHHIRKGIHPEGFRYAFSFQDKEDTYWHPLSWLSHMLDVSLFGLRAGGHHLSSLLLHMVNCILLFTVFRRMTGFAGYSLFLAALFALHPLNVESVAWVAERKNVLSTFFWILTLWTYHRYCRTPGPGTYLAVLAIFSLGLLAKPMLVTLPCVLLLLDFWPLGRMAGGQLSADAPVGEDAGPTSGHPVSLTVLVLEKIPLMALSGISVFLTTVSLDNLGTAVPLTAVPLDLRIANGLVSYAGYIQKLFWPVNLAVIYPYPSSLPPLWQIAGAGIFLVTVSLFVVYSARHRPYLLVGWLWYLGTLTPVIGIVQGGLWPAMADRWTYVPFIGLFIVVAWGGHDLLRITGFKERWLPVLCTGILILMAALTWRQAGYWRTSIHLFERTLAVTGPNCAAHDILGVAFEKEGRIAAAIGHYRKALQIKPDFEDAYYNLGGALFRQGDITAAIGAYKQALQLKPSAAKTLFNLGVAYEAQGRLENAERHYRRALENRPDYVAAHFNLGNILAGRGKLVSASVHYSAVLRLDPRFTDAHINLGIVRGRQGLTESAITHFRKALAQSPGHAGVHFNLGIALAGQGRYAAAERHFREALAYNPDFGSVHKHLANVYRQTGNQEKARRHLQKALQLSPADASLREALEGVQREGKRD